MKQEYQLSSLMLAGLFLASTPAQSTTLQIDASNDLGDAPIYTYSLCTGQPFEEMCNTYMSSFYVLPTSTTEVDFGAADFSSFQVGKYSCEDDGIPVEECSGQYGGAYLRWSASADFFDYNNMKPPSGAGNCTGFPNCADLMVSLFGDVPPGARAVQLVIGAGPFIYYPPVISTPEPSPSSVPLPSSLLLFLGGLGCLGFFWRPREEGR